MQGSGKFVTLKESTCMVSGGTTGLITWQVQVLVTLDLNSSAIDYL